MTNRTIFAAGTALVVCAFSATSAAEEYDYELGLIFGTSNSDFSSAAISGGTPMPSLGLTVGSSDADNISLFGNWYFSGLDDNTGPRSRAAFVNRASSFSFGYTYGDESSSSISTGTLFPPGSQSGKSSSDTFNFGLRYVAPDSGWYGLAGVSRIESDASGQFNGMAFSNSFDATAYSVGLGKYIAERTAVDLSVARSDTNGFDTTDFALSLTHIGSIGTSWQYAAEIGVAKSDESFDDGTYALGLSLFPTRDVEFGVRLNHSEFDNGNGTSSYEGFASWYIRDNIELNGQFVVDDVDGFPGTDVDGDSVGVGVSVRF